jgi:hypothetical protein
VIVALWIPACAAAGSVTAVTDVVAAEAGTAKAGTPAPPMNSPVAATIVIVCICSLLSESFSEQKI